MNINPIPPKNSVPAAAPEVTTREAAQILGVSLRTIQLWVEGGILAAWKTPGGHRRISQASIDGLLAKRAQSLGKSKPVSAALRVLVVEDDPTLLHMYETVIPTWKPPIDFIVARNGYEGLLSVGEFKPDVLITDLMMPGIDGFMMLKSLRQAKQVRGMRIAVVSGLTRAAIEARGGLPANVPLFGKPIDFEALHAHVDALRVEVVKS